MAAEDVERLAHAFGVESLADAWDLLELRQRRQRRRRRQGPSKSFRRHLLAILLASFAPDPR
jgi:hypothetical protein